MSVAVTQIEGQNFKMLSCLEVASVKENKLVLLEDGIKEMLEPLILEGCKKDFRGRIEEKIKSFILGLSNKKEELSKMEFTGDNHREYKIFFHNLKVIIFGFLVYPLTDEMLRQLEKEYSGKTYLTGDMSDMFKTKKDLH